ncbi:MAG: SLBB domain-containing protein [Pacificimonas sp.]
MVLGGRAAGVAQRFLAFALIFPALALLASPLAAQITPELLERLQRQSTPTLPQADPADQLDRSRQPTAPQGFNGPATAEELELRRLQSRQAIDSLQLLSPLEREYNERLGVSDLRQFGYDLFKNTSGDAGPVTGQVSDSYTLGVGDELLVTFSGATNQSTTARVARDGRLIVGSLPPIQAAGRSLGQIRRQLAGATRNSLLGTDIYVSLGGIRSITVFIGGEVERPGQYQVTSLADIASVIARAGGIRKSGSLRNVLVYRGGASRRVDLYGLLGIGAPPSVAVQEGDRIVVPVIGDTAAIAGGVARPGIYELRGGTSVSELLGYAGGAVPPRGYRVSISRIENDGQENFVGAVSSAASIEAGDAVLVLGGSAGGKLNRVTLSGFISNPGPRPLSAASSIADLIGPYQQLQLGTYLPMSVLVRRGLDTGLREYQAVDLLAALNGTRPVNLRADDKLFIFSRADIDYINSPNVLGVLAGDPAGTCQAERYLGELVRNTQSPRFNALLRNSFMRSSEQAKPTNLPMPRTSRIAATGTALTEDSDISGNVIVPEMDLEDEECRPIFESDPDLLPFVLEQTVSVGGAVRRPGAYPIADADDAGTLVAVADGILAAVREGTVDVSRDGGFERFELPANRANALGNLVNVILRPGDEIRITAPLRNGEDGSVLLTGEFRSPGLYAIQPGERLSQLIARAGGYTDAAYPYGAVFTRENVRNAERAGRERLGRQLQETVLTLAARDEVEPGAVEATSQIIAALSADEVSGRMVVEADPLALVVRPDLDPLLESGDSLFVPNKPNSVYVFGSVLNPGALQFQADRSVNDYIAKAGGDQSNSDESRIFVIFPDGSAQPTRRSFWRRSNVVIPPGSTIVVPKDLTPFVGLEIASSIAGIFGSVAQAIATTIVISDRN